MPSFQHNAIVRLLRRNPEMVPSLMRDALGVEVPAYSEVTIGDATLEQLAPTEVRADLVVELHAAGGRPRLAIVVEVQLGVDADKPFTWPAYLTTLRLRLRCDVCLLVVTPDADVAAWASRAIRLGPGNEGFRVLVLGPRQVPVVTDPAVAAANPALATLALMAHGADVGGVDVLMATILALAQVDAENEPVYLHVIGQVLSESMRQALKAKFAAMQLPPDTKFPEPFQSLVDLGEARGEARGEAKGEAKILLRILDFRGVPLTAEQRKRILECRDEAQFEEWAQRVILAKTADELFE